MDVASVINFLSPFLPRLAQVDQGKASDAVEKFDSASWSKAQKVWAMLQPALAENEFAREAVMDVANAPDDADSLVVLRVQLKKLLNQDLVLLGAIAQVLQNNTKPVSQTQFIQNVSGSQNQVISQVSGGMVIGPGSTTNFSSPQQASSQGMSSKSPTFSIQRKPVKTEIRRPSASPVKVFFSYSHKDEELRDELANHLSILEKNNIIKGWHDRRIIPGQQRVDEIDDWMNTAQIILLLISSDFIASDYCWNIEVKRTMERHEAGEACVIPIILRPVNWRTAPFGQLQALPKDALPVTSWISRDEAFLNISQGIEGAVAQFCDT